MTSDTALLGLIAPLLPEIERRTGAGDAGLGFALAAYAIPIALLSLPFGRAADAVGRRALLVAGLLFVAVGSVLVAISDSIGALTAARTVSAPGMPCVASAFTREEQRARCSRASTLSAWR